MPTSYLDKNRLVAQASQQNIHENSWRKSNPKYNFPSYSTNKALMVMQYSSYIPVLIFFL